MRSLALSLAFWASLCLALPVLAATVDSPTDRCAALYLLSDADHAVESGMLVPASGDTPAHCRVRGTIDATIRFEVRMPAEGWTGRFMFHAPGGLAGVIGDTSSLLGDGFAMATTDTGHEPANDPSFYRDDHAKLNFAFRANHLTTLLAKRIIAEFYGEPVRHAYLWGCSNGGRAALVEALRYPDDYDGIIAGAPAIAPDIIAENDRGLREQLASLRLYDHAADTPTNAAMLLFGKDPLRWMAGAWIQFVRWGGETMGEEVLEQRQVSGDLITVLRELDALMPTLIQSRPVSDSALRERSDADYPIVAIRELLLNAVMHRTYESNAPVHLYWFTDRIEIQSPGGLYGMASPENFPTRTDYRNPVIAEAMATLGYVNRFGRGVIRAQHALAQNGNPPATFELADPANVLATIPSKTT